MRQHARHRVCGVPAVKGEPELLITDPGGDGAVAVNVDVRGHPDQHPLPPFRQTREVGDLDAGIQHNAPDPETHRGPQLFLRLRVAVHDDVGLFHATGHERWPVHRLSRRRHRAPLRGPSAPPRWSAATCRHRRPRCWAARCDSGGHDTGSRPRRSHRSGCGIRRRCRSGVPRRCTAGPRRRNGW